MAVGTTKASCDAPCRNSRSIESCTENEAEIEGIVYDTVRAPKGRVNQCLIQCNRVGYACGQVACIQQEIETDVIRCAEGKRTRKNELLKADIAYSCEFAFPKPADISERTNILLQGTSAAHVEQADIGNIDIRSTDPHGTVSGADEGRCDARRQ